MSKARTITAFRNLAQGTAADSEAHREAWARFASAAAGPATRFADFPEQAASKAAQVADALLAELLERESEARRLGYTRHPDGSIELPRLRADSRGAIPGDVCSHDGCDKPATDAHWCAEHYEAIGE